MTAMIKSGMMLNCENGRILARINKAIRGAKEIITLHGHEQYDADRVTREGAAEKNGHMDTKAYTLTNSEGSVLMEAYPGYAQGEDPKTAGWPVFRTPRVDHASVTIGQVRYRLVMQNSQRYALLDKRGDCVLRIVHRGLGGGWMVDTEEAFPAQVICGLFVFCRYIEQENEFIVV